MSRDDIYASFLGHPHNLHESRLPHDSLFDAQQSPAAFPTAPAMAPQSGPEGGNFVMNAHSPNVSFSLVARLIFTTDPIKTNGEAQLRDGSFDSALSCIVCAGEGTESPG